MTPSILNLKFHALFSHLMSKSFIALIESSNHEAVVTFHNPDLYPSFITACMRLSYGDGFGLLFFTTDLAITPKAATLNR